MFMESSKVVLCRKISTLSSPLLLLCVSVSSLLFFKFLFPFLQPQYIPENLNNYVFHKRSVQIPSSY